MNKNYIGKNTDASLVAVTLPNKNRIYSDGKKMWFQFNDGSDNFGWISINSIVTNINNCIQKLQNNAFTYNNSTPGDANWVSTPGVYATNESTVGVPDYNGTKTYGILIVFSCTRNGFNGSNWVVQFWTPTTSLNGGQLFMRKSINASNGGGWAAWHKISTTEWGIG